jgi:hypothetical protein
MAIGLSAAAPGAEGREQLDEEGLELWVHPVVDLDRIPVQGSTQVKLVKRGLWPIPYTPLLVYDIEETSPAGTAPGHSSSHTVCALR